MYNVTIDLIVICGLFMAIVGVWKGAQYAAVRYARPDPIDPEAQRASETTSQDFHLEDLSAIDMGNATPSNSASHQDFHLVVSSPKASHPETLLSEVPSPPYGLTDAYEAGSGRETWY